MIHLPTQRPARIISVVAAFLCFAVWYFYQPEAVFRCEVPIIVEHHLPATGTAVPPIAGGAPPAETGTAAPAAHALPLGTPILDNGLGEVVAPARANRSKIAKVSVATNKLDNPNIHRAIKTHELHNSIHGYTHFIAANEAVSKLIEHDAKRRPAGAWTKPAYLLSLIVAELQKDEEERLEWLFWFDADTVILNHQTPLEVFVPPSWNADLQNVHLLMAANWDGLNSGVFALRVHTWSVSLLSAVLAYPIYQSERQAKDRFRDQSAFQWLLTGSDSPLASQPMNGRDHWVEVPMRWFNSIPFNNAFGAKGNWILNKPMTEETFDKGTEEVYNDGNPLVVKPWKVMQGDMVVHFAGTTAADVRDSWLGPWLDRAEAQLPEWSNSTTKEVLKTQTREFWAKVADKIVAMRTQSQPAAQPAAPQNVDEDKQKTVSDKDRADTDKDKNKAESDSMEAEKKKADSNKRKEESEAEKHTVAITEKTETPAQGQIDTARDATMTISTTATAAATQAASEPGSLTTAEETREAHDKATAPDYAGGVMKVHVPGRGEQ